VSCKGFGNGQGENDAISVSSAALRGYAGWNDKETTMKPSDISVGKTYRNKGAGRTTRRVVDLGAHLPPPHWFSSNPRPDESVVEFVQGKETRRLYLSSFAAWVGSEVVA
jgi:hypothetical protein